MQVWWQVLAAAAGFAALIGGLVYGFSRLTAGAAARLDDGVKRGFYAGMAQRGQAVALPRTWTSEGLVGHIQRTGSELRRVTTLAFLMTAAVLGVAMLVRPPVPLWQIAAEAGLLVVVYAGLYFGISFSETHRVRSLLDRAGPHAPRSAFKVVANGHGLFVPIEGRVLEGAWSAWSVTDADVVSGKGNTACRGLTLVHAGEPEIRVPLIASTFEDGERLLEVIAARARRAF